MYASPLERTRETAAPIAKPLGLRVRTERGLLECDFGDWTGAELKKLYKLPEWRTVQQYPSGFRFPAGESFAEMQARIGGAIGRLVAAHPGETVVAVSHADPIKAAVAAALGLAPRPVPAHRHLAVLGLRHPLHEGGPAVLTVNETGDLDGAGARHELRSSSSSAPDRFTAGTVGPPGQRVFYLQVRQDGAVASLRLEKQQVAALAEYLGGHARRPARPRRCAAERPVADRARRGRVGGRLARRWRTDEIDDRFVVVAEELIVVEAEEGDPAPDPEDLPDGATARLHLTREQVRGLRAARRGAGRPAAGRCARICGRPIDPDGHVCPRSNGHGH